MDKPTPASGDITFLLQRVRQGDAEAVSRLVPVVYAELRRAARYYLDGERPTTLCSPRRW